MKPGDRYISAEQAARMLGESAMTAQRAMKYMAEKNILERRPKAGTFIGSAMAPAEAASCLHFFLPEQCIAESDMQQGIWQQIQGLHTYFPKLSVQFDFVPNQSVAYVQQIIERSSDAGTLMGVVLVVSSREMREYFNTSGIPTVVAGCVESDLTNLCWFAWDQVQTG
jgi:hypothetical protein